MTARPLIVLAVAASLAAGPSIARATPADVTASGEYLAANYRLVKTARAYLRRAEAAPLGVLAKVRRECPMAAAHSPQDSQSTQLSNEVIGAMVLSAYHLDVPSLTGFVRSVQRLHWSNGRLTSAVHAYAAKIAILAKMAPPNLCADVGAWAASGFRVLPASTLRFVPRFMAAWVALGELPPGLGAYESAASRALASSCNQLEIQLTDGEARAVYSWGDIMNELVLNP